MKPSKKAQKKLAKRIKQYEESELRASKLNKPHKFHKPGSLNTRKS